MNDAAIEKLEFDAVLDRLEACCASPGGRALVDEVVIHTRPESVAAALDETTEARRLLDTRAPDWDLGAAPDMTPALARMEYGGLLEPADLHAVRALLDTAETVRGSAPPEQEFPTLGALAAGLFTNPALARRIARSIDEKGHVLDDASPALARARRRIRRLEQSIPAMLHTFVNDPSNEDLVQERIVTMRNGRFVVPVQAGKMRGPGFILQDRSASGQTAFVEPARAVEQNNELISERAAEREAVLAVLRELSDAVAESKADLAQLHADLSRMDLLLARGRLSIAMRAARPEISTGDQVRIVAGRHPLLGEHAVPVDVSLGGDTRALILTGPNAGGKTVGLKMIGLFCLMAQAGLHVPAITGTALPVFSQIHAVIGDEQSIEHSLSTFTSHIYDIARILERAGRGSLALIDEICSGTDPAEGTALACSIIKRLMDAGAVCMVTSHHGGLKTFASVTPGAANARVLFDEAASEPRYVIETGAPGKSYALHIARRAGLSEDLVHAARGYLDEQTRMAEQLITDLEQLKGVLAVERAGIERKKQEIEEVRAEAEKQLGAAEKQRREMLAKAVGQAEVLVEQTRARCRELLQRARASDSLPQQAEVKGEITQTLRKVRKAAKRVAPRRGRGVTLGDLKPGAALALRDTGDSVTFEQGPDRRGQVRVLLGGLAMTTHVRNLVVPDTPPPPPAAPPPRKIHDHDRFIAEARRTAADSVDLHGMRAAEALEELDRQLEVAHLAGLDRVAVKHGIGTGALRKAVNEHLASHPLVRRLEPAALSQGGIGVTFAILK